jgi:hypothetical protein
MDWFYPVLSGVLTGDDAKRRIDNLLLEALESTRKKDGLISSSV